MLAGGDPGQMDALSGVMRRAISGFVRDGIPSVAEGAGWPAYGPDRAVLQIGSRLHAAPAAGGFLDRAPAGSAVW